MSHKYNDRITITRSGEYTLNIDCNASAEVVEQAIIALFITINDRSDIAAPIHLISKLMDVAAIRKEE